MATYEDIYGKRVKDFDSDPTLTSSYEGQVWYDKSSGVLKSVVSSEAFSSAAPLTTIRNGAASFGTQTAGVMGLGAVAASPYNSTATEHYNGTGWSNSGNANTARRYLTGFGVQTAGVA